MQIRHLIRAALILSAFSLPAFRLSAQQVAQPEVAQLAATGTVATTGTTAAIPVVTKPAAATTGTTANPDEEVVQMSVFNVDSSKDQGYEAINTTSGSRMNTPLKDTAASIQPFTQEFLDDVGVNTIEDMLSYAGNVEAENEDSTNGFNNNNTRWAGNLDNRFRVRGMSANVSLDYTETGVPIDLYNIDRAEISSGANSILFGMGSQGGLLTLTSARANLQRTTLRIKNAFGTFISPDHPWNLYRLNLDYNVVLMPRTLAFRILGVYQEGDMNRSWQHGSNNHIRRLNPLITIKPFKNTRLHFGYERGRQQNSTYRAWNAADGLTAWLADGRPSIDGFPAGSFTSPQISLIRPNGIAFYNVNVFQGANGADVGTGSIVNQDNYVLVDNDATIYNFRGAYKSNSMWPNNMAFNRNQVRLPPNLSSYYYNTVGPGGVRIMRFDRWNASIEQDVGNFHFDLTYNHNKVKGNSHAPVNIDGLLNGDPNTYISAAQWSDATMNSTVPDPYTGRLYMESVWMQNFNNQSNDVVRLTTETGFNLGAWGRHRVNLLLEHSENDIFTDTTEEILADDHQLAIKNQSDPTGTQNQLTRRTYVDEGNFNTYYDGDWRIPTPTLTIGDKTYHSAYVTTGPDAITHTKRKIDSAALTLQSYWFNDKLVTIFGGRYDNLVHHREETSQIRNPNDPRILDGSKILNEWDLSGTWRIPKTIHPYTFSAGAVWHVTDRFSTFVNYSTNESAPYVDRQTLPDGDLPDPAKGRTLDYGVMFDLLGDGRVNLRLTKYDTRQMNDARVTPAGTVNANNAALGSQNLFDMFDAMYFLTPTNYTGASPNPVVGNPNAGWVAGTGPGMGPMPQSMYAVTSPDPNNPDSFPFGAPPRYNAGTVSVISQGYEATLTANLTRAFTMIFNFSYTNRWRDNIFPEIFKYYNTMIPKWFAMINAAQAANHTTYMVTIPNTGQQPVLVDGPAGSQAYYLYYERLGAVQDPVTGLWQMPLLNYLRQQLYTPVDGTIPGEGTGFSSVRNGLNDQLDLQSGALGSRPFKFNVTARYAIQTGWLKGTSFGASMRYSSYNLMANPNKELQTYDMPPEGTTNLMLDPSAYADSKVMIKGNSLFNMSAFLAYRCKIFGGRWTARFQLNVDNIFNGDVVTVGQLNSYGAIRRIYTSETPRRILFTTTFDF